MNTLDKNTVNDCYANAYAKRVKKFCDNVRAIADKYPPKEGESLAPAPFLPIIGCDYYTAPIRVAIYGQESSCWHDLNRFVTKFSKSDDIVKSLVIVKEFTDGKEDMTDANKYMHPRFHTHHGTKYENNISFSFWRFVFSTLAYIYNEKDIRNSQKLSSFIWGNVNSYEKYGASCEDKGIDIDDWRKISSESKRLNSAQLLLPYTQPHIMVVFYWGMTRKWLTGKKGKIWGLNEKKKIDWSVFFDQYKLTPEQREVLKKKIRCFYLSDTGTYVFKTMHPQGMRGHGKGIKEDTWMAAVNYAINRVTNNLEIFSPH